MKPKGFTLIELIVSVAIFATTMTIALGALLSMSESNRRAEALKSVVNNLNFALEDMSRQLRTGYNYHCGSGGDAATPAPLDCAAVGQSYLAFTGPTGQTVTYCLGTSAGCNSSGDAILKKVGSGPFEMVTSPEVDITALTFYVLGAAQVGVQPKVVMLLSGAVQITQSQRSTFNLQTTITQRLYDQ